MLALEVLKVEGGITVSGFEERLRLGLAWDHEGSLGRVQLYPVLLPLAVRVSGEPAGALT
jgi:hypothetical protein